MININNSRNNSLFIPILSNEKDFYKLQINLPNSVFIESVKKHIIKNADIVIFLVGLESNKRRIMDWEVRAAISETSMLKKCGIVVVYLPEVVEKYGTKIPRSLLPKILQKNMMKNTVYVLETTWRKMMNDINDIERILNVGFAYGQMSKYIYDDNITVNNEKNIY